MLSGKVSKKKNLERPSYEKEGLSFLKLQNSITAAKIETLGKKIIFSHENMNSMTPKTKKVRGEISISYFYLSGIEKEQMKCLSFA